MRVCCLTITFSFSRLHSDALWPQTEKKKERVSPGRMDSCGQIREGSRPRERKDPSGHRERRTAEGARRRAAKDRIAKYSKDGEKKESSSRACIVWLEGWQNSQGSQIPSVPQIQRQIATAEGKDHDFTAVVKGAGSGRLSEQTRHGD